jgi:3D (Asp-Asp-Asp) domain-containing protein
VFLPGAEGAGPKEGTASLRKQQAGFAARSHTALLSLYALDSRLARARSELTGLRSRSRSLELERERVEQEIELVGGNLKASQRLLGDRLRALYEEGEPDAIAVLLGATSLDDAVTRLDELERSATQGARDARDGRAKLQGLGLELAARIQQVKALEARADRTATALEAARANRISYLKALARQQRLTRRQIAALDSRASQVVAKAQAVQSRTASAPAAGTVADGARTLTVTATGYSMAGRTATGLPVGRGIVAVDPSVIPLGTRLSIPGYGEGVAADTGGSVQGLTIDLWFPTLAEALAWGRRTVTITLN